MLQIAARKRYVPPIHKDRNTNSSLARSVAGVAGVCRPWRFTLMITLSGIESEWRN